MRNHIAYHNARTHISIFLDARNAASAVAAARSSVTSQGNGFELISVIPRSDMSPEVPLTLPSPMPVPAL